MVVPLRTGAVRGPQRRGSRASVCDFSVPSATLRYAREGVPVWCSVAVRPAPVSLPAPRPEGIVSTTVRTGVRIGSDGPVSECLYLRSRLDRVTSGLPRLSDLDSSAATLLTIRRWGGRGGTRVPAGPTLGSGTWTNDTSKPDHLLGDTSYSCWGEESPPALPMHTSVLSPRVLTRVHRAGPLWFTPH